MGQSGCNLEWPESEGFRRLAAAEVSVMECTRSHHSNGKISCPCIHPSCCGHNTDMWIVNFVSGPSSVKYGKPLAYYMVCVHLFWLGLEFSGSVNHFDGLAPDNIFALPAEVFSSCLAIISSVMVGVLFLWPPCDMELVIRQFERSGHQQRLLQAFTEDVFIFSLLVYIAH